MLQSLILKLFYKLKYKFQVALKRTVDKTEENSLPQ